MTPGDDPLTTLVDDLDELATISAGGPGVTRLAYSREDALARRWFAERCAVLGLHFEIDRVGNCFGWSEAARNRPAVLLGSHLDSVVTGGRYDGTVGVVVAFEVVRRVLALTPDLPVAVVAFACEESIRFGIGAVGSRMLLGELRDADLAQMQTTDGVSFRDLIGDAGLEGDRLSRTPEEFISSYLEVHIDQGNALSSQGVGIGIVDAIAGDHRTAMTWVGESSHAGAHRRTQRRDALLAVAELLIALDRLWEEWERTDQTFAVTVGKLDVVPNNPNTVPGEVRLVVDLRCPDEDRLEEGLRAVRSLATAIAERCGIGLDISELGRIDPVALDARLAGTLGEAASVLGIPVTTATSLAGHDAMVVGKRFPAALLFVANPSGLSHSPDEDVDERALADVVRLLVEALPRCTSQQTK